VTNRILHTKSASERHGLWTASSHPYFVIISRHLHFLLSVFKKIITFIKIEVWLCKTASWCPLDFRQKYHLKLKTCHSTHNYYIWTACMKYWQRTAFVQGVAFFHQVTLCEVLWVVYSHCYQCFASRSVLWYWDKCDNMGF